LLIPSSQFGDESLDPFNFVPTGDVTPKGSVTTDDYGGEGEDVITEITAHTQQIIVKTVMTRNLHHVTMLVNAQIRIK